MGQQGFEWGEQWGLEASRHTVHMWCGSSEYARAQGGGGGCGAVQKWMLWDVVFGPVRWVTRVEHLWEECESVSYKLLAMR